MPRTRVCSRLTQPSRLRLVHTSLFPFLSRALPRHSLLHFFPLSFLAPFMPPSTITSLLPCLSFSFFYFVFSPSVALPRSLLISPYVCALCAPVVLSSSREPAPPAGASASCIEKHCCHRPWIHLTRTRCYGTTSFGLSRFLTVYFPPGVRRMNRKLTGAGYCADGARIGIFVLDFFKKPC